MIRTVEEYLRAKEQSIPNLLTKEETEFFENRIAMINLADQTMPFVPKGWGYEVWIHNDEKYCGKLLYIAKDRKFSWHYHNLKTETFFIESGQVQVFVSNNDNLEEAEAFYLSDGMKFEIKPGVRHQVIALKDTRMFEFSTQHFDSDSYRIQKGD